MSGWGFALGAMFGVIVTLVAVAFGMSFGQGKSDK